MLRGGEACRVTHCSERIRERVAPVGACRQVDKGADEEAKEAKSATGNEKGPHHTARGFGMQPVASDNKLQGVQGWGEDGGGEAEGKERKGRRDAWCTSKTRSTNVVSSTADSFTLSTHES